ncbi:MAG: TRAM domain-containing protein, partial [Kiritimatiellaeota bacterium]|nr:TRAM domain-containing protein [Kiritimatiellota bacterium]
MKVGESIQGRVESIAYWGSGIVRVDGLVVFVPGTCVGEEVTARVKKVKPRFAVAELVSIDTGTPDRIEPVCRIPATGLRVPGCIYDHMRYEAELACKQQQFREFLQHFVQLKDADRFLLPPVPSPRELHYRNKIVMHVGTNGSKRTLGYRGDDNKTVIDMEACPLAIEPINEWIGEYRATLDLIALGTDITFRWTAPDGVVSWLGKKDSPTRILKEETCIGTLEGSTEDFFPVNP